jgi:hypothetical protein
MYLSMQPVYLSGLNGMPGTISHREMISPIAIPSTAISLIGPSNSMETGVNATIPMPIQLVVMTLIRADVSCHKHVQIQNPVIPTKPAKLHAIMSNPMKSLGCWVSDRNPTEIKNGPANRKKTVKGNPNKIAITLLIMILCESFINK